ncbi:MAG: amidohydrolase [Acidobacteriota bacterium]
MNRPGPKAVSRPQTQIFLLLLTSVFAAHCGEGLVPEPVAADTIFYNGKVVTVDESFSTASAIAIKNGKFLAVGSDQEMLALAGLATDRIDLENHTVVPGFIDSHIHALRPTGHTVSLDDTSSIAEILAAFEEKVAQVASGTWISAFPFMSVDQIEEQRLPNRWELDRVSPNHPVFIFYHGHLVAANSRAIRDAGLVGITSEEGWVIKDPSTGEPNGWFLEDIGQRMLSFFSRGGPGEIHEEIQRTSRLLNAAGITSIIYQTAGTPTRDSFRALAQLRREGALTLRWRFNYSLPRAAPDEISETIAGLGPPTGYGDEWLRMGGLGEISFDGWWEPMDTAYVREPYVGSYSKHQGTGDLRFDPEFLKAVCLAAAENDIQMSVHVAGSAALDELLDIYEQVNEVHPINDKRWTIEHGAFLPSEKNLQQARDLGLIVTTQQSISYFNPKAIQKMLGEHRASNLFPNKTWLEGGVIVAGGSDFPASPISPLLGIYASVTRKTISGDLGPEEAITRQQALELYTINAARISFEETLKGSIEAGKLADFVVLSRDLLTVSEDEIKEIEVLRTVVGGKTVYEQP